MTIIGTHNGVAHADEVMAFALYSVFETTKYIIVRSRDQRELQNCHLLFDVGREFDGISKFDHHQYKFGKSSAGLVWDWIKDRKNLHGKYKEIDALVEMIDKADTGEEKAPKFSIPFVINTMNSDEPYNDAKQMKAFVKMIEFMKGVVLSLKKEAESIEKAERVIETSDIIYSNSGKKIIVLPDDGLPFWKNIIYGDSSNETFSSIDIVVWKNTKEKNYNAQVPNKNEDSFELVNEGIRPSDKAIFVHANKFFSVWKSIQDIVDTQ